MWSAQVNNRTHFGIFRPTKQVAIMLNCYCCIANMRMTAGALCNCNFSKSVCRGGKNTCRHSCRMANWAGDGDPMRLGAQVVSGIGFLSAGTIIVTQHNQFKGVTMATVLLTFAKIGLAFGVGFYKTAVTSVLGIYAILIVPQRWKIRFRK